MKNVDVQGIVPLEMCKYVHVDKTYCAVIY